jgi:predicted RNA-binding Zn-ribbon protein involved in translation (DUF1610 family)
MENIQKLNEFDAALEIATMTGDLERDERGILTPESQQIFKQRLKLKSKVLVMKKLEADTGQEVILQAIDRAKLSILRSQHTGDKVAKVFVALVGKIIEVEDSYIWKCPECGEEAAWDAGNAGDAGTPMCPKCDIDMKPDHFALFDTEEWKEADAYVLRINIIRNSKKGKNDESNN